MVKSANMMKILRKLDLTPMIKLHMLTIIARSVFEDVGKVYPQIYLDDCLYEV